jgi:hypothetical protein
MAWMRPLIDWLRRRLLPAALLSFAASSASALDPQRPIVEFVHDSWSVDSGLKARTPKMKARTPKITLPPVSGCTSFESVNQTPRDSITTSAVDGFVANCLSAGSNVHRCLRLAAGNADSAGVRQAAARRLAAESPRNQC